MFKLLFFALALPLLAACAAGQAAKDAAASASAELQTVQATATAKKQQLEDAATKVEAAKDAVDTLLQ